jgi:hypothetical protein
MKTLICLENIIGLSRTTCNCYDAGKLPDYSVSKSDLFVDELDGLELKMIDADIECGDDDIWNKMSRAVENSKIEFRKDFMKCLGENTGKRRKPFFGSIGLTEWTKSVVIGSNYVGVRLSGTNLKGAEFTLNGIKTLMDTTTTFTIEVYNNLQATPLVTLNNINAIADTITPNVLAPDPLLTFPLYSEECDYLEYYVIYQPVGFAPRNNDITCGCSKRPEWEKWIEADGIYGDAIVDRDNWFLEGFAYGLFLDVSFICNSSELICGGTNADLDFENDELAMSIAYAIRYAAGRSLIDNILGSGRINRYTMLPSETLWNLRNHFSERYDHCVLYVCQETDISRNDCLMCDDKRIGLTSILT